MRDAKPITRHFAIMLLLMSFVLGCGLLTPTEVTPQVETNTGVEPGPETATAAATAVAVVETATVTAIVATATATPTASAEAATATATTTPRPSPSPTTARPQLEIVQSQAWADRDGNVRTNVLVRNPYDFPVRFSVGARARLVNQAGESIRDDELYFLDGISGGSGFILAGETIAAHACFTCERTPLTEAWDSVEYVFIIEDATGSWNYSTEVEASAGVVSFAGDSPIFDIAGSVKNNSDAVLDRISVRVFVFDQEGNLVGAAEASAWDVAPGATANFDGYGIGEAPDGSIEYEVYALGVDY
jgi:hypothetical protein